MNRMFLVIIILLAIFEQVGLFSWNRLLVVSAKSSDQSLFSLLLAKEVLDKF